MDAQTRVSETAALVALVQSIARLELEEGCALDHLSYSEEVLAENRFLAARDGVDAHLIETTTESLRPVNRILVELLDFARPHAAALGCLAELEGIATLAAAPGAASQRSFTASEQGLVRMVANLASVFTE